MDKYINIGDLMLYEKMIDVIGNTPIVRLSKMFPNNNIYVKLEKNNLTGSIKDRPCLEMILRAFEEGRITKGSTIIEPTSGNMGISLSALANYFDLKSIIVMPLSASLERRKLIKDYGGELVLVEGGMKECFQKAKEINSNLSNSMILSQFENENNPIAHYKNTIREIIEDLKEVDVIISGIGSGGTISGIGKYVKENNLDIEIIGVEPKESPLITKQVAFPHKIQGIGANFIPSILNQKVIDKIILVSYEEAYSSSREVLRNEGLLIGISSGAVISAAKSLLEASSYQNKKIVLILPDSGERYSWD